MDKYKNPWEGGEIPGALLRRLGDGENDYGLILKKIMPNGYILFYKKEFILKT